MVEFYDNGPMRYDGDLSKGKYNGKGKYYDSDGSLQYDGEWKDGDRHGKGKSYYENGDIEYDGEWKNDKRYGKGKSYYKNGIIEYDGEWKYGDRYGKGKSYYENGDIEYDGEWSYNKFNKQGTYYENGEVVYKGEWRHGYFPLGCSKWFEYKTKTVKKPCPCDNVPSCCYNKRFPMRYVDDDCGVCLARCYIFLLCVFGISILYYLIFMLRFNVVIGSNYRYNHICYFARTITVKADFGNDIEDGLVLQEYPFLTSIIVEKNALRNIKSFVLSGMIILSVFIRSS